MALSSPAHEFLCSRKLRLAPQDYSPWTPPTDRFSGRSYPPASRHSGATTWSPGSDNPFISRGCGLATVTKAVQTRGPGRVALGSKPQLATTKQLVSWAAHATSKSSSEAPSPRGLDE